MGWMDRWMDGRTGKRWTNFKINKNKQEHLIDSEMPCSTVHFGVFLGQLGLASELRSFSPKESLNLDPVQWPSG